MASPIAWDHHYGILLPALVLAAGLALRLPAARRWWFLVLGIAFALGGSLWEPLAFVEDPRPTSCSLTCWLPARPRCS